MPTGFRRFNETIKSRASSGAIGTAIEKPVFSSQNERADCVFDKVVINGNSSVLQIYKKFGPFIQRIIDGFSKKAFRRHMMDLAVNSLPEAFNDGTSLFLAKLLSFPRAADFFRGLHPD